MLNLKNLSFQRIQTLNESIQKNENKKETSQKFVFDMV